MLKKILHDLAYSFDGITTTHYRAGDEVDISEAHRNSLEAAGYISTDPVAEEAAIEPGRPTQFNVNTTESPVKLDSDGRIVNNDAQTSIAGDLSDNQDYERGYIDGQNNPDTNLDTDHQAYNRAYVWGYTAGRQQAQIVKLQGTAVTGAQASTGGHSTQADSIAVGDDDKLNDPVPREAQTLGDVLTQTALASDKPVEDVVTEVVAKNPGTTTEDATATTEPAVDDHKFAGVEIIEAWQHLDWGSYRALGSSLSDEPVSNKAEATAAIEAELKRREDFKLANAPKV